MRLEKLPFDVVLLVGRVKPFKKNNIFDRLLRMEDGWLDYL